MALRNRPDITTQTPESPLTEMTSRTHLRNRSNSLPPISAGDVANPFLDDTDVPGAFLPATPPVRTTSPGLPLQGQPEDIHRDTIHHLPTDPLQHVDEAAQEPRDLVHGLEDMQALTNRILELETNMIRLQRERERATENARTFNAESLRSRGFREGTFASNSTYTNEHPRNKIKLSDLPKFYGKDNEDIDEWIEKVSAIFTYSGARDTELLRILPLLLQGNASEWFTTLGDEGRAGLQTWSAWKAALRNGFYLPDHEMTKRMLCRNRILKRTESFGDYFQARRALQRYVYPYGTSHKVLIKDIMEGIPAHLHPIIRANSTEVRNIEDFRRVLIDLEPGIRDMRAFAPHATRTSATARTSQVNTVVTPLTRARDEKPNNNSRKEKKGLPKTPCRCGGMHWYSDCPQKPKIAQVNQAQKATPSTFPNNIPITKNTKWKSWKDKKEEEPVKEVNTVEPRPQRPTGKKGKQGKDDSANNKADAKEDTSGHKETRISPTFALARFGAEEGMHHPVCIDTGSSISCIDSDYARRYLPNGKISPTSNLRLMGVGTNMTSGTITTELCFATTDPDESYKTKVILYVVPRLNTKILLGNDHLVPLNPVIDFENNQITFGNDKARVMITNRRVPIEPPGRRTARTRQVFTLQPGHQGKIPVVLFPELPSGMYCIEAAQPLADVYVARSLANAEVGCHFAMVSNFGRKAVKIDTGTLLSEYVPVDNALGRIAEVNLVAPEMDVDLAFEEDVKNLDINPQLTDAQQEAMRDVIRRQHNSFAYGDRKLGRTDLAVMKIETGDAAPISQPPYHASPAGRKIIDETLAELIAEDVIEESDSPWASPAILIHQKGKDRFCIDFRKVNEVTKADQYPIPRIDDILSQFSGKTFFTTFDANKGFHQIEIDPKDREKTAFRTHRGLHQYKRMPFVLKSGPGIFQRLMDKVLGRYKWQICLVYIDDIIIYSKSYEEHLQDVERILQLVGKSGITLSPKKCHLGYQSLTALGHTISNLGIGTADGTVKAVTEFPRPANKKELQRFLGLCVYYRRFVKDFSKMALPLYRLTKDDVRYEWDDSCQAAFESLKEKLTTAPTLAHPDYERPFLLYTDACNVGLGAVLAQNDLEGKEHPIVYLSRTLTPAESNYTITELECLAIVYSVRKLHAYLDGVKFTLITDHSALQWLFDFTGSNRRLVRWSMELQPYRDWMTIKYREGRVHTNADPLSRAP
ncbi:hypothetical protein NCC49_005131 [Naganishia albida]|nr:hypothetical protein NCC49_005131 [Naganishia albida]